MLDDLWGGFIDRTGKVVIKPQPNNFNWATHFSEGLASVALYPRTDCKCGFIDRTGRVVIKPQFSGDCPDYSFQEGLACVRIGERWGFIDRMGTFLVKPQFVEQEMMAPRNDFSQGIALLRVSLADAL